MDRFVPVTAATGLLAGAMLGPLLTPAIRGIPGVPWVRVALPAGAFAAATCAYLYGGAAKPPPLEDEEAAPGPRLAEWEHRRDATAVLRVDPMTGDAMSCVFLCGTDNEGKDVGICSKAQAFLADGGKRAARGVDVRSLMARAYGRGCRLYGDGKVVRLDGALARFPMLEPLLGEGAVADLVAPPSTLDLRQRSCLTTDAVARYGYLRYGYDAPLAGARTAAARTIEDFAGVAATMADRSMDEAPSERHLADAAALEKLADRALACVELLRTPSDALSEGDRKIRLAVFEASQQPGGVVYLRELDNLLAKSGVMLPRGLWRAHSASEQTRRRRLQAGAAALGVAAAAAYAARRP